jgi:ABC-2 type transport system permease protein
MEFRANFIAKVLQNIGWVIFYLLIIEVIYGQVDAVAGWTKEAMFVLAATVFFMSAVHGALFMSLYEVPYMVRRGTLDTVLIRPVDSQFWVSLRRFNFDRIGSLVAGIGMLIYVVIKIPVVASAGQWAAYSYMTLCSLLIFYSLTLFLMTLAIYFVRVENIWVLGETLLETSRFPIQIFGPNFRTLLIVVLPVGLLATVPAEQLLRGVEPAMLLVGTVWAFGGMAVTRWFWRFSLSRYSSASS